MIGYIESTDKLKEFKLTCNVNDYLFALQMACGISAEKAYVHSILLEQHKNKTAGTLKSSYELSKKDANKYAKQERIVRLTNILKESIDEDIQKAAYKLGGNLGDLDAEPTKKDIKRWLGRIIKKAENSLDELDYKEFNASVKLFLAEFTEDEDPQKKVDRHVLVVMDKLNAVCGNTNCNREIILQRGAKVICPYCNSINDCSQCDKVIVYITKEEAEIMRREIEDKEKTED